MTRTALTCVGARSHRPEYLEVDRHHIFPTYMCDLLGVPKRRETAILCAGCHDFCHHLLHDLVNEGSYTKFGHQPADGIAALVKRAYYWWQLNIAPEVPV